MTPRYGIEFYPCGQIYYFISPDTVLTPGTPVVVDTGHGENMGIVVKVTGARLEGDAPGSFPVPDSAGPGTNVAGAEDISERAGVERSGAGSGIDGDSGGIADSGMAVDSGGGMTASGNGEDARALEETGGREEADAETEGQELSAILNEALNPDSPNLSAIKRIAGPHDLERAEQNIAYAAKAGKYCVECAAGYRLDMKLVHTEVSLDGGKLIFFFTAPGRIDFRELVKALARNFHARIELRQIGVRHETQLVGAIGNCGMVCCCRRYMRKFTPVTIKMAKEQSLFLNPVKISGTCGRLLCCLSFEQHNYEEFYGRCPKLGKKYETTRGIFKVLRASLFRNSLTLLPEEGDELEVTLDEWRDMEPARYDAARRQRAERAEREAPATGKIGGEKSPAAKSDVSGNAAQRGTRKNDRRDEWGRGRKLAAEEESARAGREGDFLVDTAAGAASADVSPGVDNASPQPDKNATKTAGEASAAAPRKDTGLSRFLAAASGDDDK